MGISFSEVGHTSRKKQAHREGGPDLKPTSFYRLLCCRSWSSRSGWSIVNLDRLAVNRTTWGKNDWVREGRTRTHSRVVAAKGRTTWGNEVSSHEYSKITFNGRLTVGSESVTEERNVAQDWNLVVHGLNFFTG